MFENPVKAKVVLLGDGCTSIMQIMTRQEQVVVLRGEAKRIWAMHIAEGLASQQHGDTAHCVRMFAFWNEPDAVIGRRAGCFTEGDPDYLGLAGERVWHRYPGRN